MGEIREFKNRTNTVRTGKIERDLFGVRANQECVVVELEAEKPKVTIGKIFTPPTAAFGVD